jgi:hypothetical protein
MQCSTLNHLKKRFTTSAESILLNVCFFFGTLTAVIQVVKIKGVKHPNCVALHHVFDERMKTYLVFEW